MRITEPWEPMTLSPGLRFSFLGPLLDRKVEPMDPNSTAVPNSGTDSKRNCEDFDLYFLHVSLLPAVLIILLLSLVERRKRVFALERRFMPPCLSGRFGVVVPVDFLSTLENRWSYAFAFGAVAQHMVNLIINIDSDPLLVKLPPSLKVFMYMVAAVKVGVACMPLFACFSTPHNLLGGVLGLLYSLYWFSLEVYELYWCGDSNVSKGGLRDYLLVDEWLLDVPHLLCFGFLVCRFGFLIVEDILIRLKKHSKQEEVKKEQYKYVQRLLQRPADRSVEKSWFQKNVYEWDPYFKFPSRIISTVVLCFFCLYLVVLIEQVIAWFAIRMLNYLGKEFLTAFLNLHVHFNYFKYTWYVSSACASFSAVVHIGSVLVYYRRHIKSMWAGEKIYLPRNYKPCPTVSLGGVLKYPGYQIAFTVWGYLLVHLAMFVCGLVFVYTVISPIRTHNFQHWLNNLIIVLANFFVLLAVMGLQRVFLHMFFLQDKNSPTDEDKPLALNNRKVFHNVNYFLFFFNMILGLMSCVMRLMKSVAVGLVLLPRIERAIMPQGFEKLDKSYCTWLGMILTDHHHSNPVLVCFCHLLLEHTAQRVGVYERLHQELEPPAKERARARWLLMYTLVRNPKLILLRKQAEQNKADTEFAFAWAVSHTS
ncbi:stimulated by retinoic acid gene 6 protein-like isoform X1 [Ictalurus punctatus]|uniref:Stimulated by retinoic acid gene 6 protein-like isoform X1 n=1 Tax=Ictalurus punctatus TaxID=7998 RepID=A0A9F7R1K1_ICTPU|nr:stimulated by retinoic acid gene 6 protein-like isoform X1 [Ictalurus punctatus]